MASVVLATIKVRGDTAAAWGAANPILADREIGIATDARTLKIGDGVTRWNSLPQFTAPGAPILSAFAAAEVENGSIPYVVNQHSIDYLKVSGTIIGLLGQDSYGDLIHFLGVSQLQGRVADLESEVRALQNQVQNLLGRVAALETT